MGVSWTKDAANRLAVAEEVGKAANRATDGRHRESVEMSAAVARKALKEMERSVKGE